MEIPKESPGHIRASASKNYGPIRCGGSRNSPKIIGSVDLDAGDFKDGLRAKFGSVSCFGVDPATATLFWVESESRVLLRLPYGVNIA